MFNSIFRAGIINNKKYHQQKFVAVSEHNEEDPILETKEFDVDFSAFLKKNFSLERSI